MSISEYALELEGKVWGKTQTVLLTRTAQVSICHIDAGWQCSKHYHAQKYNRFHVISGQLEVISYKDEKDETGDRIILTDGLSTSIRPGVYHRFRSLTDVVLVECYWIKENAIDTQDIVRVDTGGPIEEKENLVRNGTIRHLPAILPSFDLDAKWSNDILSYTEEKNQLRKSGVVMNEPLLPAKKPAAYSESIEFVTNNGSETTKPVYGPQHFSSMTED